MQVKYVCDVCGKEYNEGSSCLRCESSHSAIENLYKGAPISLELSGGMFHGGEYLGVVSEYTSPSDFKCLVISGYGVSELWMKDMQLETINGHSNKLPHYPKGFNSEGVMIPTTSSSICPHRPNGLEGYIIDKLKNYEDSYENAKKTIPKLKEMLKLVSVEVRGKEDGSRWDR